MRKKYKIKISILIIIILVYLLLDNPGIISGQQNVNSIKSESKGSVGSGSLYNGVQIKYKGNNFKYFSKISYYLLNRGHVNSKVYLTILQAFEECEKNCPGIKFRIMECSRKKGGRAWPHKTHQNGLSVDFMIPLTKKGKQFRLYDKIGIWHYLIDTNESGEVSEKINIDFSTMAKHILALADAAKENGLRVKKVILKINLKDDFFNTEEGKEIKKRGIYFVRYLPKKIDDLHDDHYHVDFEEI